MKKIVMLVSMLCLLSITFANKGDNKDQIKKMVEAQWSNTDPCGQTLTVTVTCQVQCDPSPGGNMEQAGLAWVNANYYLNSSGCYVPR
jgi:hypothetical protein